MPNGSSAPHEASDRASVASAVLRSDLRAILDANRSHGEPTDVSPDLVLGLLAGLLIAKWAAHDESEREALAAFDERAFTPGLPEALGLSAWDAPSPNHADAVAEALGGMTTGNGAESAAARYVTHIAPLVTRAAESSREMYERLLDRVRQLDLGTPEGRWLAAHLFDDVLRMMLDERGRRIGEFVTPEPVAALMLSLANPKSGDRIYDPCFRIRRASCRSSAPAQRGRLVCLTTAPSRCPGCRDLRRRNQSSRPRGRAVQGASGRYSVDAVVSLPDGAFAPWTGVSASLVVFRRTKSRPTVRFVSISPKAWEEKTGDDGGDQVRDGDRGESHDVGAYGYDLPDGGAARGGAGHISANLFSELVCVP